SILDQLFPRQRAGVEIRQRPRPGLRTRLELVPHSGHRPQALRRDSVNAQYLFWTDGRGILAQRTDFLTSAGLFELLLAEVAFLAPTRLLTGFQTHPTTNARPAHLAWVYRLG